MNKPYRHGEALLLPVDKLPKGKTVKVNNQIIAHSETGHHHVLEAETDFEVLEDRKDIYIRLFEPAKLTHKKSVNQHRTLDIPTGTYKVIKKTEYDPWLKIKREVWD